MKGFIYKAVNLVNWKVYIGQTIRKVEERWKQHTTSAKSGSKFPFHSALRKYGECMFSFEVIAEVDRSDENELHRILDELEVYYIKYYDSTNWGYNVTEGGDGHSTRRFLYLECDRDGNLLDVWKATENKSALQYGSDLKNNRIVHKTDDWFPKYTQVLEDWQTQINNDIWK